MAQEREETRLPSANEIRILRREHVAYAASRLTNVVGKRLLTLQWTGSLTFNDLGIDETDPRGVIVSRLDERDLRKVVARMGSSLTDAGYYHDIELTKYDTSPHFRLTYIIELLDDDTTDGQLSVDETERLDDCDDSEDDECAEEHESDDEDELGDGESLDSDEWHPETRSDATAKAEDNNLVDLISGWDDE